MSKKYWLITFVLSVAFITWGIVQIVFSIPEVGPKLETANITKTELALNLYGKKLDQSKYEKLKDLNPKYFDEDEENGGFNKDNLLLILTPSFVLTGILSTINSSH